MKTYQKASIQIIDIEKEDILTLSMTISTPELDDGLIYYDDFDTVMY